MLWTANSAAGLQLPPTFALDQILGDNRSQHTQRSLYTISSSTQTLRQALSFARVLAYSFVSEDSLLPYTSSLLQNGPLVMDSWLDLRHAQRRCGASVQGSPIALLEMALNVSKGFAFNTDSCSPLKSKANALLVMVCSEMISCPDALVEPDSTGKQFRVAFCKALLAITEASMQSYVVGRLASRLVQELALLSTQYPSIGEDTDVWVRRFLPLPLPQFPPAAEQK